MRVINLLSSFRVDGSNEEPVFYLDPIISRCSKIKLLSANIPNSYYNFFNHKLKIKEEDIISGQHKQVSIDLDGNFTIVELTNYIATQLTLNSNFGNIYTCSWSSQTGKLTISSNSTFHVEPSTTAQQELGFTQFPRNYVMSETGNQVVQLTKSCLVIRSPELSQLSSVVNRHYFENLSTTNIIAVIPITNGIWQFNQYEDTTFERYINANSSEIDKITLQLCDINGNIINLNGVPWCIEIGVSDNLIY